jgi:hypothetical protein
VDLPANAREVTFSYEPSMLLSGAVLSLMGLALWLCLLLAYYALAKPRPLSDDHT